MQENRSSAVLTRTSTNWLVMFTRKKLENLNFGFKKKRD